jgi:HD-GYP domain-containing protein (c-di-GMP phosphodiesterase class II)
MLHDFGKLEHPAAAQQHHEVFERLERPRPEGYREHPLAGYRLLRSSRTPASAAQAVLNHHQRYDGRGWPGPGTLTHQRRAAAPAGRQIHVFTRIVSVANVLDNLLRDAHGAARPPVAALYDLAGPRFHGWFDPRVVQVLLRRLPPFPLGSSVRLSDGRAAAVVVPNLQQPCRPMVRLLAESDRDAQGRYPTFRLADHPDLRIVEWAGVAVTQWLFTLPEKDPTARKRPAGSAAAKPPRA